jgi:hypothetical protein
MYTTAYLANDSGNKKGSNTTIRMGEVVELYNLPHFPQFNTTMLTLQLLCTIAPNNTPHSSPSQPQRPLPPQPQRNLT